MISRKTIIWFFLLLAFTGALEFHEYQLRAPCRAQKGKAIEVHTAFQDAPDFSFDLCNGYVDGPMPGWVKVCVLGWLVSGGAFVTDLVRDLWGWILRRAKRKREAAQT